MAIEVGIKLQGKVAGITKFGAFIDLPDGVTGLVHISEIASNYVSDINEHLKVGDVVNVKVINIEPSGKIGLSIRKANESETPRARPAQSRGSNYSKQNNNVTGEETFDQKMSRFLKDSEDRLSSLKRNTETKRGGRGGRRG